VLVRSIWLAEVTVLPWQPAHEIPFRRIVPRAGLAAQLWMEPGAAPVYAREAGLALPCPEALTLARPDQGDQT
jgi:hypothetical protein